MKRMLALVASMMMLLIALPLNAQAAELLVPVGDVIGLQLTDDTVTIAAFDDVLGGPAQNAGLRIGDEITKIEDREIHSTGQVRDILNACDDEDVDITVRRGSKLHTVEIAPTETPEGKKLGLYLRQGIAGIGTVTWYDPESGRFGALGHGVSNPKGGLLAMGSGSAYPAEVYSVVKGKSGQPGQLKGSAEPAMLLGQLYRNTPQGVFGITRRGWHGEALPVAGYEDIHTGPATIRSTVAGGGVQEYSVEISKIYPADRTDNRNLLLHVTDRVLLDTTGGIVQGMSGSPIIQDGKLVGAVTHVLVNDPTRGYGIFIENMLEAAS